MFDIESLLKALETLYQKSINSPSRFIGIQTVSIKDIYYSREKYVGDFAQKLVNQSYHLQPLKKIVLNQRKKRFVYNLPFNELILHTSAAQYLQKQLESKFSDNLFSYRKGRSPYQALGRAEKFLTNYKKKYKGELKTKGLFLIKKDITNFTDSISTSPSSKLNQLLNTLDLAPKELLLLQQLISPEYLWEGDLWKLEYLPTGSPLATILGNFFLNELDHLCSKISDSLYIRFGDDILFLSPSLENFLMADEIITTYCTEHKLMFSPKKCKNIYFNRVGRPFIEGSMKIQGSNQFEYLGYKIDFQSGIVMKREKKKDFFNQFVGMVNNYIENMNSFYGEDWTKDHLLFQQFIDRINSLMNRQSTYQIPNLLSMVYNVSDRDEIKRIDVSIKKIISKKTKKSFKELIEDYQLNSLVKIKNNYYG